MNNHKTCNTYLSVSLFVWKPETGIENKGRIYTSNHVAKLDLHLDVDYATAKREMAKLMARTGKLPEVIGKDDPDMVMYTLTAFLD
jgi:hypothetical protein